MLHASKTRTTPFPINDRDEREITIEVGQICDSIIKFPYIRFDTVHHNPPLLRKHWIGGQINPGWGYRYHPFYSRRYLCTSLVSRSHITYLQFR